MLVSLLHPFVTEVLHAVAGTFCFLFVAAWTKREASGGTRPAGSGFGSKIREQPIINCNINFAGPGRPAGLLSLQAPKKVTKERAGLSPDFCRAEVVLLFICVAIREMKDLRWQLPGHRYGLQACFSFA